MKEIKNKIITISGEPVSGKSTVVREIKELYEEKGYNVHIISVGNVFREMVKKEYIKKYPDRTNASLADIQSDKEFMKQIHSIDGMIDGTIAKKGKAFSEVERPNDVYILDSRLAWNNVPNSYAIRLTVNDAIAGKRVFNDKKRGSEDHYKTVEDAIEYTRKRKIGEIERYKERYNVDLSDENNYDLVVDTSYTNPSELAEIIVAGEECYRTGKFYPKNWASPTNFMPLQSGRITGQQTIHGYTIEKLAEAIKKDGYNPIEGLLEILECDGVKYLLEGNHRTFGALSAGKTILPYEIFVQENPEKRNITQLIEYPDYSEYMYDYVDGIKYYGGKIGGINQLCDFDIKDLLAITKFDEKAQSRKDEEGR